MKIHYSPESVQDLQRLYDFLLPKSPLSARKAAIEIQEGVERLRIFPRAGIPVAKASDPELIRDVFIGHYAIRYLIGSSSEIFILRIWHHKESER